MTNEQKDKNSWGAYTIYKENPEILVGKWELYRVA